MCDKKHKDATNHNTKAKATSMVARLFTTNVASRALRKGNQIFRYTACSQSHKQQEVRCSLLFLSVRVWFGVSRMVTLSAFP